MTSRIRIFATLACPLTYVIAAVLIVGGCDRSKRSGNSAVTPSVDGLSPKVQSKLDLASDAIQRGNYPQALTAAQEVLVAAPENTTALSIVIEAHSQQKQFVEAADLARKLVQLKPELSETVMQRAFDWHLQCADFNAAEEDLDLGLKLQPDSPHLRRAMAQLLNAQGRRFEANQHTRQLVRQGRATSTELLSLVDTTTPFPMMSFEQFDDGSEETLFLLGQARSTYYDVIRRGESFQFIQRARKAFPEQPAVAAFQGRMLADQGDLEALSEWSDSLPSGVDEHPDYWTALGHWLSQTDHNPEAIRAFCESLRRDPTDRQALRLMIASLEAEGRTDLTSTAKETLETLDKIFRLARMATPEDLTWIATQLNSLTRLWESSSWFEQAASLAGKLETQLEMFAERRNQIRQWESKASPQEINDTRLKVMVGFDYQQWPLSDLASISSPGSQRPTLDEPTKLRFESVADELNINATLDSGYQVGSGNFFIYQANGSGLAALDYDLDGRCDIYVVQAGGKPNDPSGSTANQLFRHLPDQTFAEVASNANTGDQNYGQGVCVGDVNQDGFPDMLVANIGLNTIYINQGDGTFRRRDEILNSAPARGRNETNSDQRWTSSLGLADLDGDHLPEIVEVNYIDDPRAFEIECQGRQISCRPQLFHASADRIYKNLGDGRFTLWNAAESIDAMPNYGFGLVIANFDDQHGNDVFISNDGDLNHFWVSRASESGDQAAPYRLVESAGIRGCSIGAGGQAQGCMGIAAGDFDRNDKLDLHVTNFHNEPVNLYLQRTSGFFVDDALRWRLSSASLNVLGFGTQSADFDNDGWADLAVLNGHLYDATYDDIPFRMKPQLLRGLERGFSIQDPQESGEYWQQRTLARTLAMLDFDRNGMMDLLANHIDQPVALLRNQSDRGNWLQLELVGVASERDAIGAKVTITCGDQSWTQWQIGGDGYMCANEPILHFGIAGATTIDKVVVQWPSGKTQDVPGLKTNQRYLIVEGQEVLER